MRNAGTTSELFEWVRLYYLELDRKWPNELESLAWVITEIAEAIEVLMALGDWTRNNPEDKPDWNLDDYCTELGDAIFMLQVMGMAAGGDPMANLIHKIAGKVSWPPVEGDTDEGC